MAGKRKKQKDVEKEKITEAVDKIMNHKEELADELIKKVQLDEKDEDKLIKLLIKSPLTITQISEKFNIAKEDVWPAIDKLRAKGYEIVEEDRLVILKKEAEPGSKIIDLPRITKTEVKILLLSDIGVGFKTWQPDLLATIYKIAEEEGVYFAVVMDISAGISKRGREIRDYVQELSDFDSQVNYIADNWPKAPFNTYILNGPKDLRHMSKKRPQNMAFALGKKRDDLRYLGDLATTINVRDVRIALSHTEDDSSVYTKSYPVQGIIRNSQDAIEKVFGGNSKDNPDIVLLGGLFSLMSLPPRSPISKARRNNINGFSIPGLYPLTSSQKNRKRQSGATTVGCWILTLQFNRDGTLKDIIPDGRDLTAYTKERNYLADVELESDLIEDEKKILELLMEDSRTKGDLSRRVQKAIPYIDELIINLKNKGYEIDYAEAEKKYKLLRKIKTEFKSLDLSPLYFKKAKFGSISDMHLGCVYSRPDLVPMSYKIAEADGGIDKMLVPGDVFEGEGAYRGQVRELTHHGADAQRDFGLEVFPKSTIPSEFITGSSHELAFWLNSGHNIVETFCKMGRAMGKKLYYLATGEHIKNQGFTSINDIGIELIHPTGGIPFGISYRPQKRIEEMMTMISENETVEKIILCGHLHVGFFMLHQGIAGFLVPCLEEKTSYLAGKGYIPWLGMWIVEVWEDKYDNITRIIPRYIAFERRQREKHKSRRGKKIVVAVTEVAVEPEKDKE